jgi:GT2 family glycosyltransferase
MFDLTASVVAYKTEALLLSRCLSSLLASSLRVRVVVVDNSPTDLLRAVVSESGADYRWLPDNPGFGAGHNVGIKECFEHSKYHVVVNPDVHFEPGTLTELLRFMEANPHIGLTMPRVFYPDGSVQHLCKLLPTPADLILRRICIGPLKHLIQRRTNRYELRGADPNRVLNVPVLSGCFMFVRTDAFRFIGTFDERYFMYLEDVDLCRRISRVFDLVHYPHVSVIHEYAKGSYKDWRLFFYHFKSACKYFYKWGWLFDHQRAAINEKALGQLKVPQSFVPPLKKTPTRSSSS